MGSRSKKSRSTRRTGTDSGVPSQKNKTNQLAPKAGSQEERVAALRQVRHEYHEGPIPPPTILAQYDQVVPGAGERACRLIYLRQPKEVNTGLIPRRVSETCFGPSLGGA